MSALTAVDLADLDLCGRPGCPLCARRQAAVEQIVERHVSAIFADQQPDERRAAEVTS